MEKTYNLYVAHLLKTKQLDVKDIYSDVDGIVCTAIVDEPAQEGGRVNQKYKIKITKEK
jgi:hypothetical protein